MVRHGKYCRAALDKHSLERFMGTLNVKFVDKFFVTGQLHFRFHITKLIFYKMEYEAPLD